jgi:hypothetical protein
MARARVDKTHPKSFVAFIIEAIDAQMTNKRCHSRRRQRYALMNTKQRVSAQRGGHLAVLAVNEVGCDRISLPRNPQGRKIATNNIGIREMSAE